MSRKNILGKIWSFCNKIRPSQRKFNDECVGTDLLGNKYMIRHKDPARGVPKTARYILPSEKIIEEFNDRLGMGIPLEWNAWLRHTRDTPPTDEEIEYNKINRIKMQDRVKELETKEGKLKEQSSKDELDADDTFTQDISGDQTKKPFPTYDEFQHQPGQPPKISETKK